MISRKASKPMQTGNFLSISTPLYKFTDWSIYSIKDYVPTRRTGTHQL